MSAHTTSQVDPWRDEAAFEQVVALATRAPSIHNSQPWRFRRRAAAIDVLADTDRQLPVADPGGWAVRLSCGAAVYNLRLALAVRGAPATVRLLPDPHEPQLIARLRPDRARPATPEEQRLYRAIPRRQTNRFPFAEQPVPLEVRGRLTEAARAEGGWLNLLTGPATIDTVAALARTADAVLARDERYQTETHAWARTTSEAADGVPAAAGGPAPQAFELLTRRDFGTPETSTMREYEREPLIGLLGVAGSAPADDVHAGQVLQRVLLTATDLGLACSMVSQPIEVSEVREQLRRAAADAGAPHMVLRFGYATPAPGTGRRATTEVIDSAA